MPGFHIGAAAVGFALNGFKGLVEGGLGGVGGVIGGKFGGVPGAIAGAVAENLLKKFIPGAGGGLGNLASLAGSLGGVAALGHTRRLGF